MKKIIRLAWRNLWRNRRRTLITSASIFFAIFFALMMRSIQVGTFANMINGVVRSFSGLIQVHQKGYWDDQSLENSMFIDSTVLKTISAQKNVSLVVPRLESFALASSGEKTKGVAISGINPSVEDALTHLSRRLVKGHFLRGKGNEVLVSRGLANYLEITANDSLVLLSQGYHGMTAAGTFLVRGIIHFPSPELDGRMIFMNLDAASEFYSAENRLTSLALGLNDEEEVFKTAKELKKLLGNKNLEVMSWDEMMAELVQLIKSKNTSSTVFLIILYMIIAFGFFGTVLMMTVERKREFGMMNAVGMKKRTLSAMVAFEMLFIGLLGIAAGLVVTVPLVYLLHLHPLGLVGGMEQIMEKYGYEPLLCTAFRREIFLNQSMIVIVLAAVSIIYPLQKIAKMKVIDFLRS